MYCALCHDSVRQALIDRDRAWSREELDAKNNAERPPTFWAQVASLYNDWTFMPEIEAHPELHESFNEPIILRLEDMPGGEMTPQDARSRFADCRGKLIQVRRCTVDVFYQLPNNVADVFFLPYFYFFVKHRSSPIGNSAATGSGREAEKTKALGILTQTNLTSKTAITEHHSSVKASATSHTT